MEGFSVYYYYFDMEPAGMKLSEFCLTSTLWRLESEASCRVAIEIAVVMVTG